MPMTARPPQPRRLRAVLTIMYGLALRQSPPGMGKLILAAQFRKVAYMSCPNTDGVVTSNVPYSVYIQSAPVYLGADVLYAAVIESRMRGTA